MTAPLPARAHANMSVAERELTFDALLAEFGEDVETRPQAPDAAATPSAPVAVVRAAPQRWAPFARPFTMPSPEVLKLSGLIALAVLSLTLMFVAISR